MSEPCNISSKQLSYILDAIIGNEDAISCKRARIDGLNRILEDGSRQCIVGSLPDGVNGFNSDIDVLYILQALHVTTDDAIHPHSRNDCRAIFPPQSSGYAMLEIIKWAWPCMGCEKRYNNRLLLSSSMFSQSMNDRCSILGVNDSQTTGPSVVYIHRFAGKTTPMDTVFTLACSTWPKVADEWIYRKRRYSWPHLEVIRLIVSNGCMFVPIGEYNSPHKSLEWRISFAESEKTLVRTFNHLQMKLYALMKLVKVHVFCKYKNTLLNENIITSYHLKTIMFWLLEQTPTTLWVDRYIYVCLRLFLVILRNCLKANFLPHYFFPQCNLFKKNKSCDVDKLIDDLSTYGQNILSLLVQIDKIKEIRGEFNIFPEIIIRAKQHVFLECTAMDAYSIIITKQTFSKTHWCNLMIANIVKISECDFLIKFKLFVTLCWSQTTGNTAHRDNRSEYIERRKYKNISLWGTHIDLTTGWLKLATYFYVTEQHPITEQLLQTAIRSFEQAFVYIVAMPTNVSNWVMSCLFRQIPFRQYIKYRTSSLVPFYDYDLYPSELDIDITIDNDAFERKAFVPPLPYAYFLLFLCANRSQDVSQRIDSLRNLDRVVRDSTTGLLERLPNTYIVLNMLGVCYEIMGDVSKAKYFYKQCMNKQYKNTSTKAASVRLQLLDMLADPQPSFTNKS